MSQHTGWRRGVTARTTAAVAVAAVVAAVLLGTSLAGRQTVSGAGAPSPATDSSYPSPSPPGEVFVVPEVPVAVNEVKDTLAGAETFGLQVEIRREPRADQRRGTLVDFSPDPGTALRPGEALVATVVGPPPAPPPRTTMKLRFGSRGHFLTFREVERDPTITVSVGERLWVTGAGPDGRRIGLSPQDSVLRPEYEDGLLSGLVARRDGVAQVNVEMPSCAPPPPGYDGTPCFGGIQLVGELIVVVRQ